MRVLLHTQSRFLHSFFFLVSLLSLYYPSTCLCFLLAYHFFHPSFKTQLKTHLKEIFLEQPWIIQVILLSDRLQRPRTLRPLPSPWMMSLEAPAPILRKNWRTDQTPRVNGARREVYWNGSTPSRCESRWAQGRSERCLMCSCFLLPYVSTPKTML